MIHGRDYLIFKILLIAIDWNLSELHHYLSIVGRYWDFKGSTIKLDASNYSSLTNAGIDFRKGQNSAESVHTRGGQ